MVTTSHSRLCGLLAYVTSETVLQIALDTRNELLTAAVAQNALVSLPFFHKNVVLDRSKHVEQIVASTQDSDLIAHVARNTEGYKQAIPALLDHWYLPEELYEACVSNMSSDKVLFTLLRGDGYSNETKTRVAHTAALSDVDRIYWDLLNGLPVSDRRIIRATSALLKPHSASTRWLVSELLALREDIIWEALSYLGPPLLWAAALHANKRNVLERIVGWASFDGAGESDRTHKEQLPVLSLIWGRTDVPTDISLRAFEKAMRKLKPGTASPLLSDIASMPKVGSLRTNTNPDEVLTVLGSVANNIRTDLFLKWVLDLASNPVLWQNHNIRQWVVSPPTAFWGNISTRIVPTSTITPLQQLVDDPTLDCHPNFTKWVSQLPTQDVDALVREPVLVPTRKPNNKTCQDNPISYDAAVVAEQRLGDGSSTASQAQWQVFCSLLPEWDRSLNDLVEAAQRITAP